MSKNTPRIAAIVHIYYPEFWPELVGCLRNIDEPFDLFVTVRSDPEGDAICGKVLEDFPFARISRSENVGYDIWPFLSVINTLDLSVYDIIIKLHTKRDVSKYDIINRVDVSGGKWRQYLLRFISSEKAWAATKKRFDSPNIGAVASQEVILSYQQTPRAGRSTYRRALLLAYHILHKRPPRNYNFVAGTMFAVRASLLKSLQGVFNCRDFAKADKFHTEGLAHEVERLLGLVVAIEGMELVPWKGNLAVFRFWSMLRFYTIKFFYQRKVKKNGVVVYKVLRIPIWRAKVPLEDDSLG